MKATLTPCCSTPLYVYPTRPHGPAQPRRPCTQRSASGAMVWTCPLHAAALPTAPIGAHAQMPAAVITALDGINSAAL